MSITERQIKNGWLEEYIKFVDRQESPERFHIWSGLFAIASSLGRKTYLNRGYYKLYPNLYVCLLAGSASCRKSSAADIAIIDILNETGIDTSNQKLTPEGLIQTILLAGLGKDASEVVIYNDELATFFDSKYAGDLIDIMTALYTCKTTWSYRTIKRGIEVLKNICANFLTCATPSSFQKCFSKREMEEGFLSRLVIVFEHIGLRKELCIKISESELAMKARLIHDLSVIRTLQGEFTLQPDAIEWVEIWYKALNMNSDNVSNYIDGYLARKHDLLFKVAMLLSTGLDNNLQITKGMLQAADAILTANEYNMPLAYNKMQETETGNAQDRVLSLIARKGRISHSDLMRATVRYLNKTALDSIVDTLKSADLIDVEFTDTRGRIYTAS